MADIVAVLGHRLRSPEIHEHLRGRVDVGIDVLDRTESDLLLLSGGSSNPVIDRTESAAMSEYAVERGVDPDRIRLEPNALDTIGNGYFSARLLDTEQFDVGQLYLVTSQYHNERAAYVFRRCFGETVSVGDSHVYDAGLTRDKQVVEAERRRLIRERERLGPITPGDLDAIGRLLAGYNHYTEPVLTTFNSGA